MEPRYIVTQRVPGYSPAIHHPGLSLKEAQERAEMLRAASPECIVEVRAEQPPVRRKGKRG